MKAQDIIQVIEAIAPLAYQEDYDNSGLQIGDKNAEVTGVLISLDVTEAILEEALHRNCNMIVAHHPLIFSGLKKITGRNYVERIVQQAIKNDLIIYAVHTNLDNIHNGVNAAIAKRLGLKNVSVLSPKEDTLLKFYTYAPAYAADKIREALFNAGAGEIGKYKECSYNLEGTGTFRPEADANPEIGKAGGGREEVKEVKIEMLLQKHKQTQVLKALLESHPYEEVAHEFVPLANLNQEVGAGLIGEFERPVEPNAFLKMLKEKMKTDCIRHTQLVKTEIRKVAVCGGSGSFLLKDAIAAGADVFITGDFKYHQFFDADGKILIADIGHYESEQYTKDLIAEFLKEKFPNFALLLSNLNTNPIKYFQ